MVALDSRSKRLHSKSGSLLRFNYAICFVLILLRIRVQTLHPRANASSPCQRSSTRSDILTIIYCPYSCVLPRERGNFSSLGTIRTADRTWSRLHYRLPLRDWLSRYRCVLRSITTSWCILVKRRIENIEEKKLDSGSGFCEEVLEFYRFYWITEVQWSF